MIEAPSQQRSSPSMTTMREALEAAREALDQMLTWMPSGYAPQSKDNAKRLSREALAKIEAALSPVHTTQLENHVADSAANQAESVPQRQPERECLGAAYLILLGLPHGALRVRLQSVLAALRDEIASLNGSSAETTQNFYERWITGVAVEEITSLEAAPSQRGSPEWRPDPKTVEAAAKACEQVRDEFLSPEYAFNQPHGSICERFAADQCAARIRFLLDHPSAEKE